MDSRLIPLLLAAGWLLVTLAAWGACGRWWVWPLGVGIGLISAGLAYGWALWRQLLAKAGKTTGPRSIDGYENPSHESRIGRGA